MIEIKLMLAYIIIGMTIVGWLISIWKSGYERGRQKALEEEWARNERMQRARANNLRREVES